MGLGWQTNAAFVTCNDAEVVADASFCHKAVVRGVDARAVIPVTGNRLPVHRTAATGINDVVLRFGSRLQRIVGRLPSKANTVTRQRRADRLHGQWLNDIFCAACGSEILEDALVDGARDIELHSRVKTEAHVVEVLVGEHLKQNRRYARLACFGIAGVLERATIPVRCMKQTHIFDNLCLHIIAEVTAMQPGVAQRQVAVLVIIAVVVDEQRADNRVAAANTCIGVHTQTHVNGDT